MMTTQNRNNILKLGLAALAVFGAMTVLRPAAQATPKAEKPATLVELAKGKDDKVVKTEAEWKKILTPDQFHVLREKGTEYPGTGALLEEHRKGTFICAGCGKPLFASTTKFDSGTGWPSFYQPLKGGVDQGKDADGSGRDEITCARCGGHLGHVFDDGPKPTGLRYCMNSVAMKFVPAK